MSNPGQPTPPYTIEVRPEHETLFGMGWKWVRATPNHVDPLTKGPLTCFHCQYGGPRVDGKSTPDPSGQTIFYTYYRPSTGFRSRTKMYAHYSCLPHFGKTWDSGYVAVPGAWVVEPIIDKRGLPVDIGHLHPDIEYYMAHEPDYHALRKGAMASMPGGMPCPWCMSRCHDLGGDMIATCENDPTHIVEWIPWGG